MLKLYLKKALLQKSTISKGFCNKIRQDKVRKYFKPLWSSNFDENLKEKNLLPHNQSWLSVLKFLNKFSMSETKQVEESSNEKKGYFHESNQRFYFINEQKVILKEKSPLVKAEDYITYINQNTLHSIGLNLTTFKNENSFIVCDIDHSFAGANIIEWATSSSKSNINSFEKTFGKPIIIKTPSEGHLHLIYKNPYSVPPKLNKIKICSRLGFPIEYTFVNIELYSLNRQIIQKPDPLTDLSVIPQALFPYNYFQKLGFESLTQGLPLNPNVYKESDNIPEGRRNTFLYNFFRVDNFSSEIVLAANKILCNPPLPDDEVCKSCEGRLSKSNYNLNRNLLPNEMRKPTCSFFTKGASFEQIKNNIRLREDEDLDNLCTDQDRLETTLSKFLSKGELEKLINFYTFNLQRVMAALNNATNVNTILLVAFLEHTKNIFIDTDSYLGKSTEGFIVYYFLIICNFKDKIMFIPTEDTWYFWDESIWEAKTDNDIDAIFQQFIDKEMKYGALETRFTKNSAYKTILQSKTTVSKWPSRIPRGINFKNGVVIADQNRQAQLVPHNPKFYHRAKFPCNFNPEASLTLVQMRFLMDLAGDNTMGLNIIRYVLFLAFVSNVNQVGVFLNSSPGASKSTLVRLIQAIFKNSIVPLSLAEIKKGNTFQHDFAANKKGLVIAELSPNNSKNDSLIQFIKSITGGDTQIAQRKFGNFYEHGTTVPLFIMTSNYSAASMPMWQDSAIRDRIIDVEMPKIKSNYQIKDLEGWVMKNLESLINWVLQLPIQYINDWTRVGEVNQEISSATSAMIEFFKNELVIIPNPLYQKAHGNTKDQKEKKFDFTSCLLPLNDLYKNFRSFLNEKGYSNFISQYYETDKNIKTDFLQTLNELIPNQQNIVSEGRRSDERGFFHIALRTRVTREAQKTFYGTFLMPTPEKNSLNNESINITYIGRNQYSLIKIPKFEERLQVQQKLLDDPLKYSGVCTHDLKDENTVLIQTKPEQSEMLRKNAYVGISAVAASNCKEIINKNLETCVFPIKKIIDENIQIETTLIIPQKTSQYHLESIHKRGPSLFETETFSKYGTLSKLQLNTLKTLANNAKPKQLAQQTVSGYNPRNVFYDDDIYKTITLYFFDHKEINILSRKLMNLKNDLFVSQPSDLVYNTFAPGDLDEIALRQIMRETVRLHIEYVDCFPSQNTLFITVLLKLVDLSLFPVLLFNHSTWVEFLIQDYPQYKPLLESWSTDRTDELLNLYRKLPESNVDKSDTDLYTLNTIKPSFLEKAPQATEETLTEHKHILLNDKIYSQFYQTINPSNVKQNDVEPIHLTKKTDIIKNDKDQKSEAEDDTLDLPKRKRGRPPGSKNKQKQSVIDKKS